MRKVLIILLSLILVGCSASNSKPVVDFSHGLEENGFYKNIKALNYVELPDMSNLAISQSDVNISEMDADIQSLADEIGEEVELNRKSQMGDRIVVYYSGSVDGVKFDGGTTPDEGLEIVLGSNQHVEGFEDQMVGHSVGEKFKVVVTFPDNYGSSKDADGNTMELAGREAVFESTIKKIFEKRLTDKVIEDFFSDTHLADGSPIKTMEDVKKYYVEVQTAYYKDNYVFEYLLDNSTVKEVPKSVLETEVNKAYTYLAKAVQEGQTVDDLTKEYGYESFEDYVDKETNSIQEGAYTSLIIQAVAEKYGIVVNDEDYLDAIGSQEDLDKYLAEYGKGFMAQALLSAKVTEYFIDDVKVND